MRIDHVQIAIPKDAEAHCRAFWRALGFTGIGKPAALRSRGGLRLRHGEAVLHLDVDPDFEPATKAHPAFTAPGIDALAESARAAGADPLRDEALPGRRRFHLADPVGHRIEFMEG